MMFSNVGHRPRTQQRIRLGATQDGKLTAICHDPFRRLLSSTTSWRAAGSKHPSFTAVRISWSRGQWFGETSAPRPMRGPGAVPGLFALESAMDELAVKLKMDPLELRIEERCRSRRGQESALLITPPEGVLSPPAQKNRLEEAHSRSWLDAPQRKNHRPGPRGSFVVSRAHSLRHRVELCPNGRVCVRCATQDIGTGTYTLFAQVIHAKTGVPLDRIDVFLGDSSLPDGPTSGGSMATSALLPATTSAVSDAVTRLLHIAATDSQFAVPWNEA